MLCNYTGPKGDASRCLSSQSSGTSTKQCQHSYNLKSCTAVLMALFSPPPPPTQPPPPPPPPPPSPRWTPVKRIPFRKIRQSHPSETAVNSMFTRDRPLNFNPDNVLSWLYNCVDCLQYSATDRILFLARSKEMHLHLGQVTSTSCKVT